MRVEEFNKFVEKFSEQVKTTLCRKQDEYNMDEDRLEFFKKAAILNGNEPYQTLLGYTNKQIVSEFEMAMSGKKFSKERWLEKVVDIICYQYLLAALLEDTGQFKND